MGDERLDYTFYYVLVEGNSLRQKESTCLEGPVFLGVFGVVEAMVNIW